MVLSQNRTRLPFAVSDKRVVLNRRFSWCASASLETNQREHPELVLLGPVGLTARSGKPTPMRYTAHPLRCSPRFSRRSSARARGLHRRWLPGAATPWLATLGSLIGWRRCPATRRFGPPCGNTGMRWWTRRQRCSNASCLANSAHWLVRRRARVRPHGNRRRHSVRTSG